MHSRRMIVLASGALALRCTAANAANVANVANATNIVNVVNVVNVVNAEPPPAAAPAEVIGVLPDARLSGQGRLRFLGMAIYDARLWVSAGFVPQDFESQTFALELRYARALKGPLIAERSLKEMQRIGSVSPEQATRWLGFLKDSVPDVAEAERITGVHLPGHGARLWHNGARPRELRDAEFARAFFGIWLSPRTSEPALRMALLGGST